MSAKRRGRTNARLYDEDLARIHVDGYGFHWSGAAESILQWLEEFGISNGTVVDLGCGGGQWLRRLIEEGYDACGIDVSNSMLQIARQNAPAARLLCGSIDEAPIPTCDAATSLGEPLNYLNSGPAMRRTMRRVYQALRPGGAFIFDVRHPSGVPVPPRYQFKFGDDWSCHAHIEEDCTGSLIRTITTYRKTKAGLFRRDDEVHRLKTFSQAQIAEWLRKIGFRVRTRRGYGPYRLGPRQAVFVCRKPKK
jgi:SAM-dependent methyltransferase